MAMSVTATYKRRHQTRIVTVDWVSAADGSASGTIDLEGTIEKVVTNPGATAPTDNYDITLVDAEGHDVAEGALANRDTANTESAYPVKEITVGGTGTDRVARPAFHSGPVTFTVANAGDSKVGRAVIYQR